MERARGACGHAALLRSLHHGRAAGDPLVLPGPWDAASARVFADAGFEALATPSAGVAASLGHEDGSTPLGGTPAQFAEFIRTEHAKWGSAVKEAGIKLD